MQRNHGNKVYPLDTYYYKELLPEVVHNKLYLLRNLQHIEWEVMEKLVEVELQDLQ